MIKSILEYVRREETVNPPWGVALPIGLAFVLFVAKIAGTLLIGNFREEDLTDPSPLTIFWGGIIASVAMIWFIVQMVSQAIQRRAGETRQPPTPITDVLSFVDTQSRPVWIIWLAGLAVMIPLDLIANIIGPVEESLPLGLDRMENASFASWLGAILFLLVMAPLVEEVVFRGMLYPVFARRMDDNFKAVLYTTGPFGLFYLLQVANNEFGWPVIYGGLIFPAVLGITAGIARAHSKTITAAIGVHAAFSLWLIFKSYLLFNS
ncbi:MAG: CPBP family intramembrane metalloprotease [Chloroflexi bacterium]|nr:CPBP family intramembrane metalloprotease [Chloroflexota bacterium]